MSGAIPKDDRTGGATRRLSVLLARWRRMEPRVGVIVIVVGLATGLWLGADGDAGSQAVARAMLPSLQPTDDDVALFRRADEIATTGGGTAAERAKAASVFLESHAGQLSGDTSTKAFHSRLSGLVRIRSQDPGLALLAYDATRRNARILSPWYGRTGAREDEHDDALVAVAPFGVFDRDHATRALAIAYTVALAESRGTGRICSALARAGLSPAEALVATRATHAYSRRLLADPADATWWRTGWTSIADELCAIATDRGRDASDRHAAVDALAWIVDLPPPMLLTSVVPIDHRSEHAAHAWRGLRDLEFAEGVRMRLVAALEHVCDAMHDSEASRTDTLSWLDARTDISMEVSLNDRAQRRREDLLDRLRRGPSMESFLLSACGLTEDATDDALLARVFGDADDRLVQWLLASRVERAGGVVPSPSPDAFRTHAEWRAALGLSPLRARVTVDRFQLTSEGVAVRTETAIAAAELWETVRLDERWNGVLDTRSRGGLRAPGVVGDSRVRSRQPQTVMDAWTSPQRFVYVRQEGLLETAKSVRSHEVVGRGDLARVMPVTACWSIGSDDPVQWGRITIESADSVAPATSWDGRVARALDQCRDDWTRKGWRVSRTRWQERLRSAAVAAAAGPAPAARAEIANLLEARHQVWPDEDVRNLLCALALAGDRAPLLRSESEADELRPRGVWGPLMDLRSHVSPAAWLAVLADTDDPALVELSLSELATIVPDPEVARVALEIADRRGIELAPYRREIFAAGASKAAPRDAVELIAAAFEPSYAVIGAMQLSLFALLLALCARRLRRTRGGGTRCAAWLVTLGLVLVVGDWTVGPLDVVPDSIGYVAAAYGCFELGKGASSRLGVLSAAAFVVAAIVDVVDQWTLLEHGITPFVELTAVVGVLALAGLGSDVVRATTPPVESAPTRPGRVRPVVWMGAVLGCGLAFIASSKLRELLSLDLEIEDLSRMTAITVLGFGAALALGRRHVAPSADAALSRLPLPFVLAYALPAALLAGYALTTDTGDRFPRIFDIPHVSTLTVISTSLAVVWVLLRLLDAAGIAAIRRSAADVGSAHA